jgi:hypothetical protein
MGSTFLGDAQRLPGATSLQRMKEHTTNAGSASSRSPTGISGSRCDGLQILAGASEEFQMTYPAAYLLDELAEFDEQIGNLWRSLTPARKRKPFWSIHFKAEVSKEVAELALIAPSLIAEMTPLVLCWNAHIPVWQMSVIMAAAWAVVWWGTHIVASPLRISRITAAV